MWDLFGRRAREGRKVLTRRGRGDSGGKEHTTTAQFLGDGEAHLWERFNPWQTTMVPLKHVLSLSLPWPVGIYRGRVLNGCQIAEVQKPRAPPLSDRYSEVCAQQIRELAGVLAVMPQRASPTSHVCFSCSILLMAPRREPGPASLLNVSPSTYKVKKTDLEGVKGTLNPWPILCGVK